MTAIREWATFADPNKKKTKWLIDVTFLTSNWQCIFGCGCQGNLTEPTPELSEGCCSYGAWFSNGRDRKKIEKLAGKLTDDDWQFAKIGRKKGVAAKIGDGWRTRLVDDACIFLNRTDWKTGAGCALHAYALRLGKEPMDYKPEVCWQLPLRKIEEEDDNGVTTITLTEFGREGWGEGGQEFAWWCTEAPEAFTGSEPVYKSLAPELRETLGDVLYQRVRAYLDERTNSSMPLVRHPAEVPVTLLPTRNGTESNGTHAEPHHANHAELHE